MRLVSFSADHFDRFDRQEGLSDTFFIQKDSGIVLERSSAVAVSAIDPDGYVLFCCGFVTQWPGRHNAWAALSKRTSRRMFAVVSTMKRMVTLVPSGRIDLTVCSNFQPAHRLAKILGFRHHHHEERYWPDGGDADVYTRG